MKDIFKNKQTVIILSAIVIFFLLLGVYHDRRTCWGSNDFDTFYFAANLARTGQNLYNHEAFRTIISPYLYLPFFAVLLSPLTLLPIRAASVIWYLLNVLSFLTVLFLSGKVISEKIRFKKPEFTGSFLIQIIVMVMTSVVWLDNVSLAQVDFMIFALIILSFFLYDRKRPFAAGLIISIISVIKIYPAFLILYFLAKRRFKVVASASVGLVLFLLVIPAGVLGTDNFKDSMKSWVEMRAMPQVKGGGENVRENYARFEGQLKPKNQALSGIVARYFLKDDEIVLIWKTEDFHYQIPWKHNLAPHQVDKLIKFVLFAVIAVTFFSIDYRKKFKTKLYLSIEYSVVLLCMLLLFPMVKSHTFVPFLFPLFVFLYIKSERREKYVYGSRIKEYLFWASLVLYVLQVVKYPLVFGAGCYSILFLWVLFLGILSEEKKRINEDLRSITG